MLLVVRSISFTSVFLLFSIPPLFLLFSFPSVDGIRKQRSGSALRQDWAIKLSSNFIFFFKKIIMTLPLSCFFYNSQKVESKRKVWSLTHLSVRNTETTEGFYSGVLFCFHLLSCLSFITRRSGLPLCWKAC